MKRTNEEQASKRKTRASSALKSKKYPDEECM
jgi:hypothetical protein